MKKRLKIVAWNLLVFFILVGIVEFVLYKQGYQPGMIDKSPWFKRVDKLRELKGFETDSLGIMKISPDAAAYVRDFIRGVSFSEEHLGYNDLDPGEYHIPSYMLGQDYVQIIKGGTQNEFARYIHSLGEKDALDEVDSAYLEYVRSPINSEGFRSIPFKDYDTDKKKVLLLGDSFTWGHSAGNKTDSFADILAARGYVVFNTGITATDLPQYHAVAKEYMELLQPDVVIANLFSGNDIDETARHDRIVNQTRPMFYCTNAGFLFGSHVGIYLGGMDSTYQHILALASIPDQDTRWFNGIMSRTRFTTLAWGVLAKFRIFGLGPWPTEMSVSYWDEVRSIWEETGYGINRHYLEQIDSLCQAQGTIFLPSIIPDIHDMEPSHEKLTEQLNGFRYYRIHGLDDSHYRMEDGHFNKKGHAKYADFLDELLRQL